MLTESQIGQVWERKIAAEVRSLYFADIAGRYSRRKQIITFVTFFLSSGAAATLIAKAPSMVPLLLSAVVALLTAYSLAVSLERLVRTMAKLHYSWNQIATDYDRLWNHTYEDDAEIEFEDLLRRERELSEIATTEAPNDRKALREWQDHVFQQYHLNGA
jgi:hypothetical protein